MEDRVTGTVAVSMNPVGMLIGQARACVALPSSMDVLVLHYQDYLIARCRDGRAYVVGLGREVAKARRWAAITWDLLGADGAWAKCYKATHRMLARPAAIKLIRPEMWAPRDRMPGIGAHAAQTRGEVGSEPSVAAHRRLYDFGVTADGTFYFAMELLEGMDLETLVRTHGPQPARVSCTSRRLRVSRGGARGGPRPSRLSSRRTFNLGRLGCGTTSPRCWDFGLVKRADRDDVTLTQVTGAGVHLRHAGVHGSGRTALIATRFDGSAHDLYSLGLRELLPVLTPALLVFEGQGLPTDCQTAARRPGMPPSLRN
jgi:serine/threonine-protein kinase